MERLKTRRLTKKDSVLAPLLETEVCSDFGFIEAALKCWSTVDARLRSSSDVCKTG